MAEPLQSATAMQAQAQGQATNTSTALAAPPSNPSQRLIAETPIEAQAEQTPLQFRDPAPFIASKLYNPESLVPNPEQLAELNRLLSDIDNSVTELKSKLHGAAARRVPDMIADGYAQVNPGNGQVEGIGPKELRVFFHSNGQQYYFDVERNQYAELDAILAERDQVVVRGDALIREFFATASKTR